MWAAIFRMSNCSLGSMASPEPHFEDHRANVLIAGERLVSLPTYRPQVVVPSGRTDHVCRRNDDADGAAGSEAGVRECENCLWPVSGHGRGRRRRRLT